jgi:hypothetical protein
MKEAYKILVGIPEWKISLRRPRPEVGGMVLK